MLDSDSVDTQSPISVNGMEPLLWTVSEGHYTVMRRLLELGFEKDSEGRTPLLHAVAAGRAAAVSCCWVTALISKPGPATANQPFLLLWVKGFVQSSKFCLKAALISSLRTIEAALHSYLL